MKTLVVGMGIQGNKRKKFLGSDFAGSVDSLKQADYKDIKDVPLDLYDSVLLCVPDNQKNSLIEYCLQNKKNVLIEKPTLLHENEENIFSSLVKKNSVCAYSAYNHRFEPHLINVKKLLQENVIGKVYSIKAFYGNGTARDVRNSEWRDKGMGVFSDLAPHLLDMYAFFFDEYRDDFKSVAINCFENKAPDHVSFHTTKKTPYVFFEMSLLSWRNSFYLDIVGELGSIHVDCLCKWGPSILKVRTRKLPSGRPEENVKVLEMNDPTWELEYDYFKNLANTQHQDFKRDLWITKILKSVFV